MIFNPGLVPQGGSGGGAVVGTYTGDGNVGRTIEMPFVPALVIVQKTSNSTKYIAFFSGELCQILQVSSSSSFTSVSGKSIALTTSIDDRMIRMIFALNDYLNVKNESYSYIAFPKA